MDIVIQNGLQYNAHDSGYSNKQGGGKKKKKEKNNKRKQNQNSSLHVFRLTFKESFQKGDW